MQLKVENLRRFGAGQVPSYIPPSRVHARCELLFCVLLGAFRVEEMASNPNRPRVGAVESLAQVTGTNWGACVQVLERATDAGISGEFNATSMPIIRNRRVRLGKDSYAVSILEFRGLGVDHAG